MVYGQVLRRCVLRADVTSVVLEVIVRKRILLKSCIHLRIISGAGGVRNMCNFHGGLALKVHFSDHVRNWGLFQVGHICRPNARVCETRFTGRCLGGTPFQ